MFGRAILKAVATRGMAVYPSEASAWHFEDKIAQFLIFSAMNVTVPQTWVFFDHADAKRFLLETEFPLIFKLRTGAGGLTVRLLQSREQAMRLIAQIFGRGIRTHSVVTGIQRLATAAKAKPFQLQELLPRAKRAGTRFLQSRFSLQREKGYALFQEFIPDCDYSVRIAVIGPRAFAYRRNNEKGDFKSGVQSVRVSLSREEIPVAMVQTAFEVSERLGCQSMGYDFLQPPEGGAPILLEMCHTFPPGPIVNAHGYFTPSLTWVPGGQHPADLIALDLLTPVIETLGQARDYGS